MHGYFVSPREFHIKGKKWQLRAKGSGSSGKSARLEGRTESVSAEGVSLSAGGFGRKGLLRIWSIGRAEANLAQGRQVSGDTDGE